MLCNACCVVLTGRLSETRISEGPPPLVSRDKGMILHVLRWCVKLQNTQCLATIKLYSNKPIRSVRFRCVIPLF